MKKALILIIACICLLQINGLSQKTEVGITGGVTSSNIYGQISGGDRRGDSRVGYTLGMIIDAPIGKTLWSFQPGIHYVQKGAFTSKTSTTSVADALRYAEFQLNFIHYTKGANTRMYFGLGPAIALNLPSKTVTENGSTKSNQSITFGKESSSKYRGVDYGANALIGVRFKKGIIFSVNYTFGIRNLIPVPSGDDHLRNGCLGVRLGYIFKNTPAKK